MPMRRPSPAPAVAVFVLAALAVAACAPVALRTQQAATNACMDALAGGALVASPTTGLGIGSAGHVIDVLWPFGYSARREVSGIVLLDAKGVPVAHEGDLIQMGGGLGRDDVWEACPGSIAVVAPAPS